MHDVFTADRLTPVISGAQQFADRRTEASPPPVMVEGQREVEVERMLRTRTRKLGGRGDHVVPKWLTKWKRLPNSHNQWRLEPLRIFEEEEEKREQGLRSTRHQKTNEKQASQGSQLAAIRPPTPTTKTQIQRQFKGFELVTVDILPKWDPLHAAYILKWEYRQYPRHYFDVI
eukprot:gene34120-biopygen14180